MGGSALYLPSWLVTRDLPHAHHQPSDKKGAAGGGVLTKLYGMLDLSDASSEAELARKLMEEEKLEQRVERKKTRHTWASSLEG